MEKPAPKNRHLALMTSGAGGVIAVAGFLMPKGLT
ncbi:hypothetical protein SALGADO_51 [Arthrobacter phage Salgado]|uniref:Uncharacterized protein n=2 Tax=Laroyevirus TaxID=1982086 RepID=A0A0U4K2J3_9CAUD|nr:hypothetical protein FDH64_gp49 [Arthrobacter phage Laroye]YP_010082660.1 hypothetical protein KMD22_gp51 [Arthrobacter phage Salgado]ALY09626.1 hypothetical protein LAROYE_49 [Arthrobacter phage Laroye]ALY10268.1 hypothetical protein SALGADO_51 [Arthrobacter phage Salgado]